MFRNQAIKLQRNKIATKMWWKHDSLASNINAGVFTKCHGWPSTENLKVKNGVFTF